MALADEAGDIVRSVAAGGSLGQVKDKSGKQGGDNKAIDPQTQADRRAERLIVATLRSKFGDRVKVLGEESLEGALTEAGSVNADGTIDEDDEAISVEVVNEAAELVKPIELHVPPSAEAKSDDVCVWVDPLDGTREYVEVRSLVRSHCSHGDLRGRRARGRRHPPAVCRSLRRRAELGSDMQGKDSVGRIQHGRVV